VIKHLNSKTIQGFIGYPLIGSVKPHANTPLRAVPDRVWVSLCLLGFIIKRSDISQYSISAIPVGVNSVCLAEYISCLFGSFSRETRTNVVKTTLQSFGEDARPKFRIMAKQTSFLHGEGRTLHEYRIAGVDLACFLVVQKLICHPC
jgi:hypothetical protein